MAETTGRLLIQIASYNTNLQGNLGLPQDLVDWLSPTLQVSTFLSRQARAPDIVAVGFQELLPLHLGLSGLSKSVVNNRSSHILSQIEANAPNKERYSLVAKIDNVGVALLVYARDDGVARKVRDIQTQWTGCGPMHMGNKGAVGVRFCVEDEEGAVGEVFTFVCAHLAAHESELQRRIQDFNHIVSTLLFAPNSKESRKPSTLYDTSHLFFFGDLNFRVSLPDEHPVRQLLTGKDIADVLNADDTREQLKEYDQLFVEKKKGNVLVGLSEGEFWRFKCSYKYELGEVDRYSGKRVPSWTDRILYTTYTDSPDTPDESHITNLLYTSVPSYTTSDHKPIVSLVLLPPSQPALTATTTPPILRLPENYVPEASRHATRMRYTGRAMDRVIGLIWCALTVLGAGNAVLGIFNALVGLGAWSWSKGRKVSMPAT